MQRIQIIDSHTGGEPTRLVIDGFPDLGNGSMAERMRLLSSQYDTWRSATCMEPRGNEVIVGALLCKPHNPIHAAGVIFFNNTGYLGMCGHGTIGVIASLAYMGRLQVGEHIIETPVGNVGTILHEDGSVSVRNIPAYRLHHQITVDVPQYGKVTGDVAWGGNWFFLVTEHGQRVNSDNIPALTSYSASILTALKAQDIYGAQGALIDHVELFTEDPNADSRNFVLCSSLAYDRSPCGTGTSAKLACLAADGKLKPNEIWRQASIIGSQFQASYTRLDNTHIIPTIHGKAHICAETTLIIDDDDPFAWGIRLNA